MSVFNHQLKKKTSQLVGHVHLEGSIISLMHSDMYTSVRILHCITELERKRCLEVGETMTLKSDEQAAA